MDTLGETAGTHSVWLLGICGMGVGPLAIYMRGEGWNVSGWDDAADSPMRAFLETAGVEMRAEPDVSVEIVGRSSAVKPGNPHYDFAVAHGKRMLRRGELLAERVAEKKLIAVCGSHGKTTTSGMLAQALAAAGTDAGYVLGGLYRDAGTPLPPAHFSRATDWVVAEVDESDGTIKNFSPEITVAVNLDWDHPDYYRSEKDLEKTFRDLFLRTKRAVFIPENSARLVEISRDLPVPAFTVGPSGDFAFRVLRAGTSETEIELGGKFAAGTLTLPVVGSFNTMNAVLALAATAFVGDGKIGIAPLGKFPGMRRRQDVLYEGERMKIFADYAHHPTEISALLKFLRETHIAKIIAVFQPHRYSRTRQYAAEFARALSLADRAFVLPVYSAGEAHISGGDSCDIVSAGSSEKSSVPAKIEIRENAETLPGELFALAEKIKAAGEKVVVAFIGAGNIDKIAAKFARAAWLRSPENPPGVPENFSAFARENLSAEARFETEKNLAALTTFGLGGNAEWFAEPATDADLETLLRGARIFKIPVAVIGRGSNLLVPDDGFRGLAIRLAHAFWKKVSRVGGNDLRVVAGTKLKELCAFAAKENLGGFEFLEGIPGTLGGALRMNAGAHGNSIFDRVVSVEWLMPDGSRHRAAREHLSPVYRDCAELHGAIILSAILRAECLRDCAEILDRQKKFAAIRKNSQPRERSAGCTFRNPAGTSAGKIIDELGLKNSRVGGAEISDVHANFIIAKNGATAADVIALVRRVRGIVKAERGIDLSPEIVLLGASWEKNF